MRAIIQDNKWIWFDNITAAEDEMLWVEFSVTDPNVYVDQEQLSKGGLWDGVYRKYTRHKQRMARPFLSRLKQVCQKHNLPLSIKDTRPAWPYSVLKPEDIVPDFLPGITLDPHQIRAIQQACRVECGIVDIPTGGGKGEVICGICKAVRCPTVIIADQTVVIDQLKARLELRDIDEEIGLFYAGKRPSGEMIVVGSIQSLSAPTKKPEIPTRKTKETDVHLEKRQEEWDKRFQAWKTRIKNSKFLQQYIKSAEMLLVDECDKAVSDQYKQLFRHYFNGRRRYGFSGTPFDPEKPVQAMVMQEHLGSPIISVSRRYLEKIGRIIPCEYFSIGFGLGDHTEASAYDIAYKEWMIENKDFHRLIAALCKKYENDGTVILVDSIPLGQFLEAEINTTGIEAHFICGETSKCKRTETVRAFEKREFNVLIGGKIINRGLDLSGGCENLVIATGGKLQSEFIQKVGRAVRHNRMGRSRVFDFYFN